MFRFIHRVQGRSCSKCQKEKIISLAQGTKTQAGRAYRHEESYCITSHMLCSQVYVPSASGILNLCRDAIAC
jgi:hypothetical protein